MIESIFIWATKAMEGSLLISLGASFVWGIMSILLSPCHLASIPLIIGFVNEQGKITTKRAFKIALLFSVGILVTIGLVGVVTAGLGRMLGDVGTLGNYLVAIIFFVVGLHLLDVIPMPFVGKVGQPGFKRKGLLAAFVLGLLFGIALGPCTFAYMMPVLTVAFRVASTQFLLAALLVLLYGIGHCSIIVLAGTFTEVVQKYLNWNKRSKGAVIVKRICGVLVIFGGIYLIWSA
ncbi:MAG: cytochrome C biogenesis protein [Candidatus Cloacimonetes bacterium]|nr:cytochrome C biogenesis protein [Candidatus Cloacimonadota bacterium]MBS3768414.1 cytochrome C biogenesis protein [Candidatus Cloacimonadota bacterium]